MGRRSLERTDPAAVRELVGRHFRRLTSSVGVNLAQYRAQLHEEEMVELLVDFAKDPTGYVPASLRRQCMLDVIAIARGPLKPWNHDGQTIDIEAQGQSGRSVADEIESARRSAEALKELDLYVRQGKPPAEWPEHVRLAAGDSLAFFEQASEAEAEEPAT